MQSKVNMAELRELYSQNVNIIHYLEKNYSYLKKTEIIKISYDLQAGSYIEYANANKEFLNEYTSLIAKELESFKFSNIMEVGCGEATTLKNVVKKLNAPVEYLGFDISLSRLLYGNQYLQDLENNGCLFTGDLFNIPLLDNSVDIVYSSHSLEPNGGSEEMILKELYRIAKKYIVLLEPTYEFADEIAKERMVSHGYVVDLYKTVCELGYKIIEHRKFETYSNPLNPTGIIIIEKDAECIEEKGEYFRCPLSNYPLTRKGDVYYSKNGGYVYPIISNIPCLLSDNAVLSTHYEKFI
ncbi:MULTISPECIES: methyltransferase domain-containing protein [unclassified Halobacteriovorax]|uniref:methyltransferase domain-containing protein n=1 Tax=unclassified Halobacteriovorax TaxID=2639665 RepID=UPI0039995323